VRVRPAVSEFAVSTTGPCDTGSTYLKEAGKPTLVSSCLAGETELTRPRTLMKPFLLASKPGSRRRTWIPRKTVLTRPCLPTLPSILQNTSVPSSQWHLLLCPFVPIWKPASRRLDVMLPSLQRLWATSQRAPGDLTQVARDFGSFQGRRVSTRPLSER